MSKFRVERGRQRSVFYFEIEALPKMTVHSMLMSFDALGVMNISVTFFESTDPLDDVAVCLLSVPSMGITGMSKVPRHKDSKTLRQALFTEALSGAGIYLDEVMSNCTSDFIEVIKSIHECFFCESCIVLSTEI